MPSRWDRYPQSVRTARQRVLSRCHQEDRGFPTPCLIWDGEKDKEGYGKIKDGGRYVPVHWVLAGSPPEGMEKDHLCHQRDCIRPTHLEDVTPSENTRRRAKVDRKRLDKDTLDSVYLLLQQGISVSEISTITGVSRRTVGRLKGTQEAT